jgi:hypothetical protein
LNPIASTTTPGLVSQRTSSAVSLKTLSPPSMIGSSGRFAEPLRLRGEGLDPLAMPVEHLLDGHRCMRSRRAGGPARTGGDGSPGHDREGARHAEPLVPGDRAEGLVVAGVEGGDLERLGLAGLKLGRLDQLTPGVDRKRVEPSHRS